MVGGCGLRHTPDKGEKPVSGTPSKLLLPMFVVLLVVFVLIGIILETCTDSTVPGGIVLQQHLVLLPCGCLHINMWNNGWHGWLLMLFLVVSIFTKIYISLLFLYGLYAVIACFGYLKWKQLMNLSYERV